MDVKSKDNGKVISELLDVAEKNQLSIEEFVNEILVLLQILQKTLKLMEKK